MKNVQSNIFVYLIKAAVKYMNAKAIVYKIIMSQVALLFQKGSYIVIIDALKSEQSFQNVQ